MNVKTFFSGIFFAALIFYAGFIYGGADACDSISNVTGPLRGISWVVDLVANPDKDPNKKNAIDSVRRSSSAFIARFLKSYIGNKTCPFDRALDAHIERTPLISGPKIADLPPKGK